MLALTACASDPPAGAASLPVCAAQTPEGMIGCVDESLYARELAFIAQPRPPGSPHWQAVQDLCARRFAELGFGVERQSYGSGMNVVGTKEGSDPSAGSVVVGAHYDSIDDTCPAADDNASGTAGVLETARVLAGATFRRSLVVVCWDEEEAGLIGSRAHAQRAASRNEAIYVVFAYEMIAYHDDAPHSQSLPDGFELGFPDIAAEVAANEHRGDFLAIVANELAGDAARRLAEQAGHQRLNEIVVEVSTDQQMDPAYDDLRRSDHASYWDIDVGAMMLTDTANFRNPHYHCYDGQDEVGDLSTAFAGQVLRATVGAVVEALQPAL